MCDITLVDQYGPTKTAVDSSGLPLLSGGIPLDVSQRPAISEIEPAMPDEIVRIGQGPLVNRFLDLLTDVNLTLNDVDERMMREFPQLVAEGWTIGSTRKKLRRFPILARTASEARMMLWRSVDVSKETGYRVIAEAMQAERVASDGTTMPDHDIRLKAADRMFALMGENVNPAGAKTNITVNGDSSKILITTSGGEPVKFPMRDDNVREISGDGN